MSGNISVSDTAYQIRHTEAGVHAIRQVDPEAARPEGPPIVVDLEQDGPSAGRSPIVRDSGGKADGSFDRRPFLSNDDVSHAVSLGNPSFSEAGSGEFFDLLVVYTPSARAAAGGTSGIESLIQLGVTETNLAYQNSGIVPRIRLVHTEEVSYTESGNLETDLGYLRLGLIDGTHALRDTYGADLVQIVTDSSASYCGLAYVMSGNNPAFSWWSFSAVEQSCISPNYSFGHELAHNMGCNHAPGDPLENGAYPYSIGYKHAGGQFRTLMAYNTGCNCTRVLHHSNQNVNYQGMPTGSSGQDNSLSINNVRFTVSGFREEPSCSYSISPSSQSFQESGGSGSLTVLTTSSCSWTATSSDSWITVTAGASGSGNGTISYTVASNSTINSRAATITAGGEVFNITQDGIPCTYSLSPGSNNFDSNGGGGSFGTTSPTGCTWTASSSDGWVTITAGGSGSGNGTISYTVASNSTINSRAATITAGGQVFNITQDGIACTYSLSAGSNNFDSNGGGASFGMTSPTGCAWTASSSDGWVTITAGASGSGNGTISYSVASNPTINARAATITAGGQVFSITQDGIVCTYSLSPGSNNFDSNGGGASFSMTSPTGCAWTASSSDAWVTITGGASGSGNGTISYTVASNPTINARSATITAGGQVFSITQDGIVCTYSLSPGGNNFDSNGGGASFSMTSPTGCTWTASSSDAWVTITAGASGSGNGTISYTVASNPTINARSATITAGGQVYSITQDGIVCTYSLSPGGNNFDSNGGGASFSMTSPTGCTWTASSSDAWVTITAGGSGSGNGTISYTVASNPTINARSATITAGGQVYSITQDGIVCTYSLSPGGNNFDSNGGGASFSMTSPTGCTWTASSSDAWVTITAGASGSGNGTISYTVASNPTINARSATITAGGQVFSITQDGIVCTYSLSPGGNNFDSNGGGASFGMTSPTGCAWTASSSDGWVTITAGASGSGNGTISYTVASNPTINSRAATITAGGQVFSITQDGIACTYSLSPGSNNFDSNGGGASFGMTSPTGCAWTASSSDGWVTITAGASGSGNGTISYTVASNPTINSRAATITAGGQVFSITQDGIACTYSLSPGSNNFDSNGGGGSFGMTSPTGCAWTASSSDGWVTITAGASGSGNGTISYSVGSNSTINSRVATITAGGQVFNITQDGIACTYSLSPGSNNFDSNGGGASFGMTSPTGCAWTASSSDGWVTITAGASGSGNGTISYTVASNPTINSRAATITAGGQVFSITQDGIACTYSLSPGSNNFDSNGGGGSFGMTSPTGCAWTASSSDGWVTITAGASGSGNGTISYSVGSNSTINSRAATITAGGQVFSITQDGIACTYSLSPGSNNFDSNGGGGSFSMISPTGCAWTASSSDAWITITAGASGSGNGSISYSVASNPTIQTRSGTITSSGQTLTITQTGIDCTHSLSPSSASFDSDGGSASVSMTSPTGCSWTASSNESWITITAGASGSGDGTITYTVDANSTIQTRTGTITAGGQTLTITQSGIGCSFDLSASTASFDSDGGGGSVGMSSPAGCDWTASSNESWITITAGASGSGDGTITYTVDANSTIQTRTATIAAAGQTLTITQSGIDCSFDLSASTASFDSDGGGGSVGMTSPMGCDWTASSNESWITITAGASGSGDGTITYTVDANSTIQTRTATIAAAGGQTLTITQSGIDCSFDLSASTASFDSDGGGGSVGMTSPMGCDWTASSNESWITITAGASGSGDGTITYTVDANSTIQTRTATIAAAGGQTLTITQSGIDCSFDLSASTASFDSDGGGGSVGVTSPAGCDWTASSNESWITITAGASGSGDGTITYTVDANSTIQTRTGTIAAAGQTLTITQSGIDCSFGLSASTASFDSDGGDGSVGMTSPAGCDWTASSNESWITITAGASGSGDGTITYTVDANSTIQTRTGTITAAGQTLTITQSGIDCSFGLSASTASFDSDGGDGSVGMTSPAGCDWTASSNESWITITAGASGSGDGTITYTVDANSTIQTRTGTITAAGKTLTITQSGIDCSFDLSLGTASFDSDGGSGTVSVTSPSGCIWAANSSDTWISINGGGSGSGNGSISYTVAANPTLQSRSGTIAVEDQVLTLTQEGISCAYALSPNSASFESDGGSSTASITAPDVCSWSASSSESWITITAGTSGGGNGSLSFTVAPNTTIESRSGTIAVEDQVLTITQSRVDCSYSLSSTSATFDSDGGSGTVSITSPDGCSWTASSTSSWIDISSGANGSGSSTLSYTVEANLTVDSRVGSLIIGGEVLTLTQEGISCTYSLSSGSVSFDSGSDSGTVGVSSPSGCAWTASSSDNWITLAVASGNGDGSISYSIAANSSIQSRSGTITMEGQVLTITQGGIDCTYSLSPSSASFDSEGGSSGLSVSSPDGCQWSVSSSDNWISVTAGNSGSGDGPVSFTVAANGTIQARSGSLSVGGQVFTITQDGIPCSYSLSQGVASFDADGGSSISNVNSPDGCEWSASSSESWITISSSGSGSGSGSVSFTVAPNDTIQSRSGTITVEGQLLTISQDGIECTYSLSSSSASFDSGAGSGSIDLTSPIGCSWTASSSESWITISAGASGSGDGSVSFAVAANSTIQSRAGVVTVGGQVLTITQGGIGCTYSLSLHSASFDSGGGSSSVGVSSPSGCEWAASTNDSWITITAGAGGSGDGSVAFSVAPNTTIQSRSGSVLVGGQAFTITQDGIACIYSLTSDSVSLDAAGGSGSVGVNSPDGCEWSASNGESWIAINPSSGSGDSSISFTAAANTTIYPRSGTITVEGRVLTISQDGIDCSYSLSSSGASFAADGGSSGVSVSSPDGCEWTASSSESWVTIGGGASGNGDGPLSFSVSANPSIQSRSGTIIVEGQVLTITQGGIDCTYSLSPGGASLGSEGGSSSVEVTSPNGCEWSASSSDSWITIGAGASGSGDGVVSVSVAANPTIQSRSGSIMVGGQAFTIAQDGVTCGFSLSSSSASFDADSGSSSVSISSPDGCEWSASASDSWIAITAGADGSGEGSISFGVTANSTIESRSGTITVEGQVLTITQGGIDCTYALSPSSVPIGFEGGNGSLGLSSPEGCEWSSSSSETWITITSGGTGSGSGSVSFTVDDNSTIQSRSGSIEVGGQVSTIIQDGISCTYTLSSSILSLDSDGGISSIGISSPDGCEWSASSGESWIIMGAGSSGSGSGDASFTVAANDTIQSRSGSVVVEGQVLTLTQEGIDCTYSLSPTSASFDPEGSSGAAVVTSPEGCEWSASASESWIEISSGGSGSGTGSISFTVASNESTQSRTAAITVAEQELTITQGGIDCSYSLSPSSASFDAEDGSSSVGVTSPEGCEWSASASESWITISSGSNGSGSGSVSFTVDANATTESRAGTIVAGGQVFAIAQDGVACSYAISPDNSSFDSEGGSSSATVTSPEGCEWSASSSSSWILIDSPANGSGSSDVSFTVAANDTIESRSGTIVVEGQVLTVTQDGIDCTYSLSPTSASFDPEGGSSTANVTSPEGCEWSASSSDSWITISDGAIGSGNGSLAFTVEANSATEPRSGTITVEDRVLTITQSRIDCSLSLSSISFAFESDGGEGTVDVTSPDGCNWSAFSGDSWIAVSSGASANGNGSVAFIVDANSTTEPRSGTITVEDEVLTITQSGAVCDFSLSSDSVSFDSEGGEGSVGVLSPSGCSWSASTGDGWIALAAESHGDGDGFVSFAVNANSVTESRSGTITIEDQVLTVTQSGIECTYSVTVDNVSFNSDGGSGSVDITTPEGCSWSAASSESWVAIAAGSSGGGSGSFSFTVAANDTVTSRSASIAIEDQALTITQDGLDCSYSLSMGAFPVTSAESSGSFAVTSPQGCGWSAASSDSWILISAGAQGNGSGLVSFTVAANPSPESRSGSIAVEDQVMTIEQGGIDCSYSLSSNSTSIDGAGGNDEISVSAPEGCSWTVSSNAEWIVIAQGDRGTGNGSFLCVVEANPTIQSRSGTLQVEGQTVMVTQAGAECAYAASATSTLFEGDGGSGSVTVNTLDGCDWSASSNVEWIVLGAGTASSGNGAVEFEVLANPRGESRTGTVAIEETVVMLTQAWDSGPTLEIVLSAAKYSVGDFVEATSLLLSNPGPEAVETELWIALETPGGVQVSFFHLGADGSVLLPSQFSEDFGPVTLFEITPDLKKGKYILTGLVRNATTADLLSQDTKTFVVVGGQGGGAGDARIGIPQFSTSKEGWLRTLERLAKPRGEQRKALPVPKKNP